MLGLARRTFDGARRQDMDVGLDAHHTYDAIVKRLDVRHLLGRIGREELVAQGNEARLRQQGVARTIHGHEQRMVCLGTWPYSSWHHVASANLVRRERERCLRMQLQRDA